MIGVSVGAEEGRKHAVRRQEGSVTAETAVAMFAVVLLLALVIGVARGASAQVSCVDAARAAARLAARGESDAVVAAEARRRAPPGARVEITSTGLAVRVRVSAQVEVAPTLTLDLADAAEAEREAP